MRLSKEILQNLSYVLDCIFRRMSSMFSPAFQYIFGKEKKHTLMFGLVHAGLLCLI
jgi:hypothetical protein